MKALKSGHNISPNVSLWRFFQMLKSSEVRFRIWPKFELFRDFMVVIITCKNEEDPIKNAGTRVATRLYVDFSDFQGQITL